MSTFPFGADEEGVGAWLASKGIEHVFVGFDAEKLLQQSKETIMAAFPGDEKKGIVLNARLNTARKELEIRTDAKRRLDDTPSSASAEFGDRKRCRLGWLMNPQEFIAAQAVVTAAIPDNGTNRLRIKRKRLVDEIIDSATSCAKKHVWLRGARGFGKTTLLVQVAAELDARGFRVLVASRPDALQDWFACHHEIPEDEQPQYFIVDEVQEGFSSPAVKFLCSASTFPCITIFAGIPVNDNGSSILANHWNIEKLLFEDGDMLSPEVVEFFSEMMMSGGVRPDVSKVSAVECVEKVLKFSRDYCAGHAYPCLKMAEYLASHIDPKELQSGNPDVDSTNLLKAITSSGFEAALESIILRCFDHLTIIDVISVSEALADKDCNLKLSGKGLWSNGWLLSPLLHKVLLVVHPARVCYEDRHLKSLDEFGPALARRFAQLDIPELSSYDSMNAESKGRCEDLVAYNVGESMSVLCDYISPQYAISSDRPTTGRPTSFDFYIGSPVNTFVIFTKNRNFCPQGQYRAVSSHVVVDINGKITGGAMDEAQRPHNFTYDLRARVLYDGNGNVVHPMPDIED